MIVEMQEFMSEQSQALGDQVEKFRKNPQSALCVRPSSIRRRIEGAEASGAHGRALGREAHGRVAER